MKTQFTLSSLLILFFLSLSINLMAQETDEKTHPDFQAFSYEDLLKQQQDNGKPWLPFLNVPTLLTGLYVLPADSTDRQQPHAKDEVYYVVKGKAKFQAGEEVQSLKPGDVLFVKAGVSHRFLDIEEELQLIVFFTGVEK